MGKEQGKKQLRVQRTKRTKSLLVMLNYKVGGREGQRFVWRQADPED